MYRASARACATLGRQLPPLQAKALRNCGGIMRGLQRGVGGAKWHQSVLLSSPPKSFWVSSLLRFGLESSPRCERVTTYYALSPVGADNAPMHREGSIYAVDGLLAAPYVVWCRGPKSPADTPLNVPCSCSCGTSPQSSSGSARLRRREDGR